MSLNTVRDEVVEAPRERTIVDKGEVVQEHVHHVVHHVVQPVRVFCGIPNCVCL